MEQACKPLNRRGCHGKKSKTIRYFVIVGVIVLLFVGAYAAFRLCFRFSSDYTRYVFSQTEQDILAKEFRLPMSYESHILSATYYQNIQDSNVVMSFEIPAAGNETFLSSLTDYEEELNSGGTHLVLTKENEQNFREIKTYRCLGDFSDDDRDEYLEIRLYQLTEGIDTILYQVQSFTPSQEVYDLICKTKDPKETAKEL